MLEFRDSVKVYSKKIVALNKQERIELKDLYILVHDDYNVFYDNYLEVNQSGFEALKSSGYLGKIQNTKIEKLLYDYYRIVNYIAKQEQSLNNFIENMEVLGFENNAFPRIIEILENSDVENYFQENQNEIKSLIKSPSIYGANLRASVVTELINSYKNLLSHGDEIIKEINAIV